MMRGGLLVGRVGFVMADCGVHGVLELEVGPCPGVSSPGGPGVSVSSQVMGQGPKVFQRCAVIRKEMLTNVAHWSQGKAIKSMYVCT